MKLPNKAWYAPDFLPCPLVPSLWLALGAGQSAKLDQFRSEESALRLSHSCKASSNQEHADHAQKGGYVATAASPNDCSSCVSCLT